MADVMLLHPPVSFSNIVKGGYDENPPIGILYLAACLEKHGISVEIVDNLNARLSFDELLAKILDNPPRILGFSSTTPQMRTTVNIAKAVKNSAKGKDIVIALGNCHVSSDPTVIERHPYFDFGIIGEAELTFLSIVKRILGGEKVKGIFRGEAPRNLDEIPYPAYHLIDLDMYVNKLGLDRFPLISTRGCPFKCIFCSRPGLSTTVRSRSAANIVDEIEKYRKVCKGRFTFLDDSFSLNRRAVHNLCDELERRKIKIDWITSTRFDSIDDKLLGRMAKNGCKSLCFGVESADEEIRNKVVKKRITDAQIYEGLKLCQKHRIDVQLSFIIGLPGETEKEILKTVMFPKALLKKGISCIETVAMCPAVPLPGSPLFDISIEEGLFTRGIIDEYINGALGNDFREGWPIYMPKGIKKDWLLQARRQSYASFYFRPQYIMRRIRRDVTSWKALKKDVREAVSLIKSGRSKASFA